MGAERGLHTNNGKMVTSDASRYFNDFEDISNLHDFLKSDEPAAKVRRCVLVSRPHATVVERDNSKLRRVFTYDKTRMSTPLVSAILALRCAESAALQIEQLRSLASIKPSP